MPIPVVKIYEFYCTHFFSCILSLNPLPHRDFQRHGGHKISPTKIQDISGLCRTFSRFFLDIREAKVRTFQDHFQEMVTKAGHKSKNFRTYIESGKKTFF